MESSFIIEGVESISNVSRIINSFIIVFKCYELMYLIVDF